MGDLVGDLKFKNMNLEAYFGSFNPLTTAI